MQQKRHPKNRQHNRAPVEGTSTHEIFDPEIEHTDVEYESPSLDREFQPIHEPSWNANNRFRDDNRPAGSFPTKIAGNHEDGAKRQASDIHVAQPTVAASILDPPTSQNDPDGEDVFIELDAEAQALEGTLKNVAMVRLGGQLVDFDAGDVPFSKDDTVVVETDRGLTIGVVAYPPMRRQCTEGLRRLLRKVDQNDQRQEERNKAREAESKEYCRARIRELALPMKLVAVEYLHNGSKAVFYFTADNRIDFRELVKDLAHRLHTRVEMRQIGVRDGAKMTGAIGSCGQTLCCSTWLQGFDPVSIRMAKDQNLVLNPTKVSGQCGRLKCCLAFEQQLYREARSNLPKVGKRVKTPTGEGEVQELDVPRMLVTIRKGDGTTETLPANLITQLKGSVADDTPSEEPT
ncbi:MAG: regulatory iron-sulfur-containing complex subunit RicT [Pseudomonadota bacterium]